MTLFVAAASLLALAAPAQAAFPGANGKIAFHSDAANPGSGIFELFTVNPDGTGLAPLMAQGARPSWSADGRAIVFQNPLTSPGDIYFLGYNPSAPPFTLTCDGFDDRDPAWSPGSFFEPPGPPQIVFSSARDGNHEIYKMNFLAGPCQGTNPTRLTTDALVDVQPVWSPDGSRIAFVRGTTPASGNIYTMNATDGSGLTQLTTTANNSKPDWAPDGSTILFHSTRTSPGPGAYTMNAADGSNQMRISTDFSDYHAEPVWSPTGTKVAYRGGVFPPPPDLTAQGIITRIADGNCPCYFSGTAGFDAVPDWQPVPGGNGTIVVKKDAIPDDPQDFGFTTGNLSPASFQLDDDGITTNELSDTMVFDEVVPDSGYSVLEPPVSGWDTNASCDDGTDPSNIDVSAGETVTCTFTNTKTTGRIIVKKDADPDDPQDFDFSAGGGLSPTGFQLDDDPSDGTLPDTQTFDDVLPGNGYSITETEPSGWTLAGASCDDGSDPSNIDVSAGETVTCTFTNTAAGPGRIVVRKDAVPNDPQDFDFTAGGGLTPTSFQLDDDPSEATLSDTQTFEDVPAGTGYSVAETVPSGWQLNGAGCDDGSDPIDIHVSHGETVTCTFTNSRQGSGGQIAFTSERDGNLEIYVMNPDGSGQRRLTNNLAVDFQPSWSPDQARIAFTSNRGGSLQIYTINAGGTDLQQVTQDSPLTHTHPAWSPDGTRFAFVHDDPDPEDSREIYTMNADGTGEERLTLNSIADTEPAWSPDAAEIVFVRDCTFCIEGGELFKINADGNGETRLTEGTFGDNHPAWSPDGTKIGFTRRFANPAERDIFTIDTTGGGLIDLSNTAGADVSPAWSPDGAQIAFETDRDNCSTCSLEIYKMNADGGSPIGLTNNAFHDNDPDWRANRSGRIIVRKDAVPNDPQDFSFTAGGGLAPTSFQLDDDSDPARSDTKAFVGLFPQSGYSISETVPSGWDLTSTVCDDGSPVSNIDVSSGETVTCTFTNRKRGTIVVRKDADPDGPQNFSFTAGGGLTPTSFQLDDDSDGALSNTRTFTNVLPGSGYSFSETVPADWYLGKASCDDGSPVSNIDVTNGETVTCTFINSVVYARPGSATPLRVPLVPRYEACTAPNSTHVTPLAHPSCTPTALESDELKTSTVGRGVGSLKLNVLPGDPGTEADEADIALALTVSDVLVQSGGADYVGKTILRMAMRITDRGNGTAGVASATVQDVNFDVPVDCVAVSGVFGSNCNLTTTLDALEPGTAKEGKRAVISMPAVTLDDAGPNGTIAPVSDPLGLGCPPTCGDGDEQVFLEVGVFAP